MEAMSGGLLKKCELKGVEETGRELLQGCYYAKHTEVTYKGLKCLARTLNPDYLVAPGGSSSSSRTDAAAAAAGISGGGSARNSNEGGGGGGGNNATSDQMEHLYDVHCARLVELRHPRLLQFIGVRFEPHPHHNHHHHQVSLVSEQLPMSLAEALQQYGKLPDSIAYSILRDVAVGMVYLHSRSPTPVIHGELAPHNVFLTLDMTAKIADMGVSHLLNLTASRRKAIGHKALVHLPPESLALPSAERTPSRAAQAMKSKKLDSYSYGVLMIHTLSADFPDFIAQRAHGLCGAVLSEALAEAADAPDGVGEVLGGVSTEHPLSSLILQCVNLTADLRPELAQILSTINEMMLQFPVQSPTKKLEILQSIAQSAAAAAAPWRGNGSPRGRPIVARKDSITTMANTLEIEHLKLQIEELRVENRGLRTSMAKQRDIIGARDLEMAAKLMAKDQEIMAKCRELSAQEAMVEACKATITAKEGTLSVLTNHMQHLQGYITNRNEPHLLNPRAQLKWRQCAHLPQAMVFAQAVTIGDCVYFGSGMSTLTEESDCLRYMIYKYNSAKDKWGPVSSCPVIGFGMVNYEDRLTLVGGAYRQSASSPEEEEESTSPFSITGDIHMYNRDCSKCEKTLPAMSCSRLLPTVLTYGSTIVALGGFILDEKQDMCLSVVEVYSQLNSQWYRAEPLPFACIGMSFSSIRDHYYFLGGFTDTDFDQPTISVFSVCLPQLIEEALVRCAVANGDDGCRGNSDNNSGGVVAERASDENGKDRKLWQSFPDSPRYAASLIAVGGCLVAIGGSDENLEHKSGALHVYSPLTTSWLRLDDIPVACFACTVPRLPNGELMLIGGMGHDEEAALKTVFRGRVSLD